MAKKCCNPVPTEEKKDETMYKAPWFNYGDRVEVFVPEDLQDKDEVKEDSYFPIACFYDGQVGTVVDVWQYKQDNELHYTVKLDVNLGTEYDEKTKYITISEKYLDDWSCDDDIDWDGNDYNPAKSIISLANEKLNNPNSEIGDIIIARTILDAFEKADKFDALHK